MLAALSLAAASRMSQTPMLAVRSILLAAPSLCCSLHRTAAAPFAAVTSWKKLINSRLVFLHLLQQRVELLPPCSRAHTHTHAQTPQDTHGANAGRCSTLPTWALGMLAKVQREDWMLKCLWISFSLLNAVTECKFRLPFPNASHPSKSHVRFHTGLKYL